MIDLIDRWETIDRINDENIEAHMDSVMDGELHRVKRAVQRIVASMPSAEKTGRWIKHAENFYACSVCSAVVHTNFNYCPNCGAKMEE